MIHNHCSDDELVFTVTIVIDLEASKSPSKIVLGNIIIFSSMIIFLGCGETADKHYDMITNMSIMIMIKLIVITMIIFS